MLATSGPPSRTPSEFYDPGSSSWRTSQGSLDFGPELDAQSATWPTSGTTRGGACWELTPSAPPTAATGGSASPGTDSQLPTPRASRGASTSETRDVLLPTPVVTDSAGTRNRTSGRQPDSRHHDGLTLTDAVWLLPTPAAADGERTSETYARGNPTLSGAMLPTPTTRDGTSGPGHAASAEGSPDLRTVAAALFPTAKARDWRSPGPAGLDRNSPDRDDAAALLPTPKASDGRHGGPGQRSSGREPDALTSVVQPDRWGRYAAAVARWATVVGRPAPDPTEPGTRGQPRLSPRFVEWLMGAEEGTVTDVPGVSRSAQLARLGNGVVPQQAAAALRLLLGGAA